MSNPARSSHPARARSPQRTGVAVAPGGWGPGAWGAVAVALIALFGLLFWLAADPFGDAFERLDARLSLAPSAEPAPAGAPAPALSEAAEESARVEEPRSPAWTLLDVEGAVNGIAPQIEELIAEGRSELPEFKALSSNNATRAARARERYGAWARIWRNRVGRLTSQMPPETACSVHAAMDPACRSLRSILVQLESVAEAEDLEAAQKGLDETAEALDFFLNPPEPEEEDPQAEDPQAEEEGEEAAPGDESEESGQPA